MARAAPLPQPMLARSGPLPTRADWAFEVKWDGFRALGSTEKDLQVRSRRGWNMTDLVPELAALPVFATLDGGLVAFGPDGTPDFPTICERMLMRRRGIQITYVIFGVLTLNGENLTGRPFSERCESPREGDALPRPRLQQRSQPLTNPGGSDERATG